jgi:hypothetical protein
MAVIDYKSAVYQIGPSATQEFTFWWGAGSIGVEYFDVSIGPDPDPRHLVQLPLVEVQRATVWEQGEEGGRVVLLLTLRNENDFLVNFIANHVRIADF